MKILIPTWDPQSVPFPIPYTQGADVWIGGCHGKSAAVNRNLLLSRLEYDEIAIMLDDDIEGFYPGWIDDLCYPIGGNDVVMVSARLLKPNGEFAHTCSRNYLPEPMEMEVQPDHQSILPTAAIAFRYLGMKFDERFWGSGFEDSDWCFQYLHMNPSFQFIQSNRCKLIHRNEMKGQREHWIHNRGWFQKKWHGTACYEQAKARFEPEMKRV